jgi:hypothetical protein
MDKVAAASNASPGFIVGALHSNEVLFWLLTITI